MRWLTRVRALNRAHTKGSDEWSRMIFQLCPNRRCISVNTGQRALADESEIAEPGGQRQLR